MKQLLLHHLHSNQMPKQQVCDRGMHVTDWYDYSDNIHTKHETLLSLFSLQYRHRCTSTYSPPSVRKYKTMIIISSEDFSFALASSLNEFLQFTCVKSGIFPLWYRRSKPMNELEWSKMHNR